MAKNKINSSEDLPTTTNIGDDVIESSELNSNNENFVPMLTEDEVYKSIADLKPKAKYLSAFEENEKAIKDPTKGFKRRQILLARKGGISVSYDEIQNSTAYSIKKYSLYFMFDLTPDQRKLLETKPLSWFALKAIG